MLYVIPFIILLVVAIILKKREAGKEQEATPSKANARKTGKKPTKTSNHRARPVSREVTPVNVEQKKTTLVPQELHQKIEKLIQAGNYSAAEAQINQALNRDNSQYGLYLYLLDIHLLQKDEFAVDQLIKQLNILNLQDIVIQAEAKRREYQQIDKHQTTLQSDAIEFSTDTLSDTKPEAVQSAPVSKTLSNADFDALVQSPSQTAHPAPIRSEDAVFLKKDHQADIEPLEFDFSFKEPQPPETAKAPEILSDQQGVSPDSPGFSFTLEPREISNSHIDVVTPSPAKTSPEQTEKPAVDFSGLEFSVDSIKSLEQSRPAVIADEQSQPQQDLADFRFDQLELEPVPSSSTNAQIEPAPASSQPEHFTLSDPSSDITSTPDSTDPLIRAFPELAQTDQIQLDLDLAAQYIELGAYDSARILLNRNEAAFSATQSEISKKLLNQIAS